MSIVTLTPTEFADLVRLYDAIILPTAIAGFCYAVTRHPGKPDIYRVAIA